MAPRPRAPTARLALLNLAHQDLQRCTPRTGGGRRCRPRFVLTVSLLLGFLPVAPRITCRIPGASVSRVLGVLPGPTGKTLKAAAATARDVLAVNLRDVPVEEAMAKIAWAVGGTWEADGPNPPPRPKPGPSPGRRAFPVRSISMTLLRLISPRSASAYPWFGTSPTASPNLAPRRRTSSYPSVFGIASTKR